MADRDPPIHAMPLPSDLAPRYHGWQATTFAENETLHRKLVDEGQSPRVMAIACCDSRVNVNAMFQAKVGDIFLHRNIANVVPPCEPDGRAHGTSAALEYGITALRVSHLLVIGHSQCGGVQGCQKMCSGHAPELEEQDSFVGRWLDYLRPGYERVAHLDPAEQADALEKEGVLMSLENLWSFPFVRDAVEGGRLSLHGLWIDIRAGRLEQYVPESGAFVPV